MSQPSHKTIMFADVSGSTRLFQCLPETEAVQAIAHCLKCMEAAISQQHGRTLRVAGDELQAIFDLPEQASLAAIDMQLRVAAMAPISGLKLTIRVGLHCGEIVEQFDTLLGEAVNTTARIAGMARADQILASQRLVDQFPPLCPIHFTALRELSSLHEGPLRVDLVRIDWQQPDADDPRSASLAPGGGDSAGVGSASVNSANLRSASIGSAGADPAAARLSLRYRGKVFLLDAQTPSLSLGRDPANNLLIEDRKASRAHGRIELRKGAYFYLDRSTNGSFVSHAGQNEVMVRKDEIQLRGAGRICFGSSRNDPHADYVDFEYV